MVIVDPYEVAGAVDLGDPLCKEEISGFVRRIVRVSGRVFSCYVLPEEVVEEGPKN
jgi:hypothetical protein